MTDTTPPTLTMTGFTQFGTDGYAAPNAEILLDFSEAVELGNSGSITLRRSDTHDLVETFDVTNNAVTANGSTVTIDPTHDLAYATGYYLTIDPGSIHDIAGNGSVAAAADLAFQTTTNPDAPVLQAITPTIGDVAQANPATDLVLGFSEPVHLALNATVTIRRSDDDAAVQTLDVAGGGLQLNGSTITVHPAHALDYATGYYLELDPETITDGTGHSLSGSSDSTAYSFHTASTLSALALDGETFTHYADDGHVARDADLTLHFDDTAQLGNSGSITLRRADTKAVVETFNVTHGVANGVSTAGSAVTIHPSQALDYATGYYLTVSPGSIRDQHGDIYGVQDNTTLAFQTTSDGVAPTLDDIHFTHSGSNGNPTNDADIVLDFNESVRLGATGSVTLHRASDNAVVETLSVTGGALQAQGSSIIIDPTHDLAYATEYYLTVDPGAVRDSAGNGYAEIPNDPHLVFQTDAAPGGSGGSGSPGLPPSPTPGPNLLSGTGGNDTIAALAGNDTVNGGGGNDMLFGNQGDDVLTDGDGMNTIYGGLDNDRIMVGNGNNLLFGNQGADTIQTGNGDNTVMGGQDSTDGADRITTGSGNDLILGNGGDDVVAAGGGRDTVVGGFARDFLAGNQGNDLVLGNQGDDTLYGGMGDDTLYGGQNDDVLWGNQGDDVLHGNQGANTFGFNPGDTDFRSGVGTGDTIVDFKTGSDRIDFASGPAGTAQNFGATGTTSTDFATIQGLAQSLLDNGDAYAFVADGADGYLFTTGGSGTAIKDAVKLTGAGSATSLHAQDIAHGAIV